MLDAFHKGLQLTKILLVGVCLSASVAAGSYHFDPDQRMIYDVNVTAQLPDGKQTITGHLFYIVKSVDDGQATINFFAPLSMTNQVQTFRGRTPFFGINYSMPREIVMDQWGRVVRYRDEEQLPYLLGNVWDLALEPSPGTGRQRDVERTVEIEKRLNQFPLPWAFDSEEHRSAEEKIAYDAVPGSSEMINKTVDLATDETTDGQPVLRETGNGQIAFDSQSGWVKSADMNYRIVTRRDGVTVSAPVTVHLKLLSPADAKAVWDKRQDDYARMQREIAEKNRPKVLDDQTLDDALAKLKAVDSFRVQAACEELEHAIVNKARQSEVANKLEPLLKSTDQFVSTASAKAMAVWAEKKNIPSLSEAAHSSNVFLRMAAIDALGHIHDPRAAQVIADQLPDQEVRMSAENALINMGPVAEPAVLPLLKDHDWPTRLSACKILGTIGTSRSLGALQTVSNRDDNGLVSQEADRAEQSIRDRQISGK